MKPFMDGNFLLETETAQKLYHEAAKDEPIFDYHCHLIPAQIAENKCFKTITEVWLGGDHYKWRMMRAMGFDEYYITGGASDYDKFLAWAKTVQELIGNPLYHWTHLELQRYFGITEPLSEKSAPSIWEKTNAALSQMTVKDIFERFKVYAVGTTDDPVDSLEYHKAIGDGSAPIGKITTKVLPSFRPDKALNIDKAGFADYIKQLSAASGIKIDSVDALIAALEKRIEFFAAHGCRASDHALEEPPFVLASSAEIETAFKSALAGNMISPTAALAFKTKVLTALAGCYANHGMAMQLHFAAIRNINSRMAKKLGPDTGYDAVHDNQLCAALAGFLDLCEQKNALPKTILYSLNPADYYPLATIMGGFQHNYGGKDKPGIKGKIQLGSGWWFCDHKDGMEEQMKTLANVGMLSAFVGMLTDSRSFLSYPRHEYFRRILCNVLGGWVETGAYPADFEILSRITKDICFGNIKRYLE
ncbi:MAG: glucuronate isomerase [Spirochaetaceae bacterium]|nr:glucuronate isomerase [Spirochaetaceae bacterium]